MLGEKRREGLLSTAPDEFDPGDGDVAPSCGGVMKRYCDGPYCASRELGEVDDPVEA